MLQLPLFEPESDWSPPEQLPDKLLGPIGYDVETHDPDLNKLGPSWPFAGRGKVIGYSIAADNFKAYLPVGHEAGGNMDRGLVERWLNHVLADETQPKIMANASYDLGWSWRQGVTVRGPVNDVQIAMALLDENRTSYSLDAIGRDLLKIRKDETLLNEAAAAWGFGKKVKANLWRMPPRLVGPYAERDSDLTREIWKVQHPMLEKQELLELMRLESDLLPIVVKMRKRGVRINEQRAAQIGRDIEAKENAALAELREHADMKVDVWSSKSLGALYEHLRLPYARTAAGNPSFEAIWLEAQDDPVSALVLRVRKLNKARSTFVESAIQQHTINGRIHCEFHTTRSDEGGTVSGRFSSSNPNLQQVPSRDDELAPLIRSLFLPEEDHEWASFDYSEQEPRTLVHFASITKIDGEPVRGAMDAVRYYNEDPNPSFHTFVAGLTGLPRKSAKIINLGLFYGMGGAKLCRSLGLPVATKTLDSGRTIEIAGPEGEELLKQYHERLPFVRVMTKLASDRAKEMGFIRTLMGRRCRFDLWEPTTSGTGNRKAFVRWQAEREWPNMTLRRAYLHKALNRLIQGSSADMIKRAMVMLYTEYKELPHLQVHDELAFSTRKGDTAQREQIRALMCRAVNMNVPLKVDVEVGPSWGEAA